MKNSKLYPKDRRSNRKKSLEDKIGKTGITLGALSPINFIRIDGVKHVALCESKPIPESWLVLVIGVNLNELIVKPLYPIL